jgi:hypothetical protein
MDIQSMEQLVSMLMEPECLAVMGASFAVGVAFTESVHALHKKLRSTKGNSNTELTRRSELIENEAATPKTEKGATPSKINKPRRQSLSKSRKSSRSLISKHLD